LNACTAENIELLKPTLLKGFTIFDKFDYDIKVGPVDVRIGQKDVRVQRISEILNMGLTFNTTSKSAKFVFEVKDMIVTTVYKAGGTAVMVPIRGAGPALVKIGKTIHLSTSSSIVCDLFR